MESKSAADGRYRTLLEVSGAIASQPNLKAVLQSLRRLLSSVVAFDSLLSASMQGQSHINSSSHARRGIAVSVLHINGIGSTNALELVR